MLLIVKNVINIGIQSSFRRRYSV